MVSKDDKKFYLSNGKTFSTLKGLAKNLKEMSEEVYSKHVNKNKNDFAVWTHLSMNKEKLAKKIEGEISKIEMELEVLRHLVHESTSTKKTKTVESKKKITTSKKKNSSKRKK